MPSLHPTYVPVRPRVRWGASDEPILLEDAIADRVAEDTPGILWITGGSGSGKTMALEHLRGLFEHLVLLDEPSLREAQQQADVRFVVATSGTPVPRGSSVLRMVPWCHDDLVEYLLAVDPAGCKHVMSRLAPYAKQTWPPLLAGIVLERFLADPSLTHPRDALLKEATDRAGGPSALSTIAPLCFAMLRQHNAVVPSTALHSSLASSPHGLKRLLQHRAVILPLAVEFLVALRSPRELAKHLSQTLPIDLVEECAVRLQADTSARHLLQQMFASGKHTPAGAMLASILLQIDPGWRPGQLPPRRRNLSGGYFANACWDGVELADARLVACDLEGADLRGADLSSAQLGSSRLNRANLSAARLPHVRADRASFVAANLSHATAVRATFSQSDFEDAECDHADFADACLLGANLAGASFRNANLRRARLAGANFNGTDLSGAVLCQAKLPHVDLRGARLASTNCAGAVLTHAQLEDVQVTDGKFYLADLSFAHLTGSVMPAADLLKARLQGAHLAEIHWERANLREADLRGVSFHMGSSRSGLVGSPIAMEGSMTGFYTDDREELYFKRPELIRKANLRGADMRGVEAEGVDFYLVDLREARLDPQLERQARRTGAILDDYPTQLD